MTASDPPSFKSQFLILCFLGYALACLALVFFATEYRLRPPPLEVPVVEAPDFAAMASIPARKAAFFAFLQPLIDAQNSQLQQQRLSVLRIRNSVINGQRLTEEQQQQLAGLRHDFAIGEELSPQQAIRELLIRVDELPAAMVLAQAAMESAWGTSRFARLANNYFGQWCFSAGCGLVPEKRANGARHEVRRFASAAASVAAYFHNINTHSAYADVRSLRALRRRAGQPLEGAVLVAGLERYSGRGTAYIEELREIIRTNNLMRYE